MVRDAWNLIIKLNVNNGMMHQNPQSPYLWIPPPYSFVKLNFDGASKGNPGLMRGGGVFRNDRGEILYIYTLNLDHKTNNVVMLNTMIEYLKIAIRKKLSENRPSR